MTTVDTFPRASVAEICDALEERLEKQRTLIAKASAAFAIEDDASSDDPVAADTRGSGTAVLPATIAALRDSRRSKATPTSETPPAASPRSMMAASMSDSACQTDAVDRERELESEIERLKQRHRQQLLAAERDLARFRARAKATASATAAPSRSPAEGSDADIVN